MFLPVQFFDGLVASQKVGVGYTRFHPSFRFGLELFQSPSGGSFSDLGDYFVVSLGVERDLYPFKFSVKHSYKHTMMMHRWWYHGDSHVTSVRGDVAVDLLRPYVFSALDIPSYTPVDETYLFAGAGIGLSVPIETLNSRINFDVQIVDSVISYGRDSITSLRFQVATEVDLIGGLTVSPEFNILRDLRNLKNFTWIGTTVSF